MEGPSDRGHATPESSPGPVPGDIEAKTRELLVAASAGDSNSPLAISVRSVVLVHGSGPSDEDESIGALRPFKDLAWGLASWGIAVLRYVKRRAEF
jgi:hypothetical protein